MSQQYVVAGFAVPDELSSLHELLARASADHPDLAPTDVMLFETAVIEIAGNVVEHGASGAGAKGAETTWTFSLTVTSTELRGTLEDNGAPFEGSADRDLPEDELAESGRGLALARAALDQLDYERADGHNRWAMVRTIRPV